MKKSVFNVSTALGLVLLSFPVIAMEPEENPGYQHVLPHEVTRTPWQLEDTMVRYSTLPTPPEEKATKSKPLELEKFTKELESIIYQSQDIVGTKDDANRKILGELCTNLLTNVGTFNRQFNYKHSSSNGDYHIVRNDEVIFIDDNIDNSEKALLNVLQDYEVNSNLLFNSDWDTLQETTEKVKNSIVALKTYLKSYIK